jgi:hypothetical protein
VASDARITITIHAVATWRITPGRRGMPPAIVHATASTMPNAPISPQMTQTGAW